MTCHYCGGYYSPDNPRTKDHKIPIVKGGTDRKENIVDCCKWCNTVKSVANYEDFVRFSQWLFLLLEPQGFPKIKPIKFGKYIKMFSKHSGIPLHKREPYERKKPLPPLVVKPPDYTPPKYIISEYSIDGIPLRIDKHILELRSKRLRKLKKNMFNK